MSGGVRRQSVDEDEGRPLASIEILDDVEEHHVVVAYAEHSRLTRRAQALISFCTERLGAPTPAE